MIEAIEAATAYSQTLDVSQLSPGQTTQLDASHQNIATIIQQAEMLDQNGGINQLPNAIETSSLKNIGEEQSFGDKLFGRVSMMDGKYTDIMDRMKNDWPGYGKNLAERGVSLKQGLESGGGITHISNIGKGAEVGKPQTLEETVSNRIEQMEQFRSKQATFQAAAIQAAQDTTFWSMSAKMWMTKVQVLTSAVSQISTGFRTLFNAQ